MTKKDLIEAVTRRTGANRVFAEQIIEATIEVVKDEVAKGESIFIRGFGTMKTVQRKAKQARDISRDKTIFVPERHVPVFKPCNEFKEKVNESLKNK